MEKTYRVRIANGDGRPVDDLICAKNGLEAHDLAKKKHPASRTIYIMGVEEPKAIDEETSFGKPTRSHRPGGIIKYVDLQIKRDQIDTCLKLRANGSTHEAIAGCLGVGKTTVSRWLKQYG